MNKKIINITIAIFLILLSVLLYKSTDSFSESSIVTTSKYIKFLAIMLGITSFVELIKSFLNTNQKLQIVESPKKFTILVILLVIYVGIMKYLGFVISSLIFLPITIYMMGYKKPLYIIINSIIIVFFVYMLFAKVFEIPLPQLTIFQGI